MFDFWAHSLLRAADCKNQELTSKTENSKFLIFGQERPFGELFAKIAIKVSKEFSFLRNPAKCENAVFALQPPLNFAENWWIFKSLAKKDGSRYRNYLLQLGGTSQ